MNIFYYIYNIFNNFYILFLMIESWVGDGDFEE